ncbi:phage/plasmid primase, P4 family [Sphingopyxis sp. J-6]|uniref:phage/plasmid primase, P4 family n=1 Tax=Sphingopyxis sp. J-6 TaxID=3122054 RepID=UPI0039843F2A
MTENRQNLPRLAEGATLPEAASAWAAAGWRVHPCSPETKRPFLAADIDKDTGKKIKSTGGVSKASADADLVAGWWKKWRHALIGVAMGDDRVFVVDFDPRHDDDTGEEWTLDRLKADTEAMMGCALPLSVTSRTPSGGTHLWLRWPDDGGDPIRNSGSLPKHVDVRGEGGYVIVPPGTMGSKADNPGGRYRWLKDRAPHEIAIAEAPAELVALLRTKPQTDKKAAESDRRRAPRPPRAQSDAQFEAQRKYALSALDSICRDIRQPGGAGNFGRNDTLNAGAYAAAALVAAGVLDEGMARAAIDAAAKANPGRDDPVQLEATLNSGWTKGYANPKDLSAIGARATGRPMRPDWVRDDLSTAVASAQAAGHSPSPVTAPHPALSAGFSPTLPDGRDVKPPSSGEGVAMLRRGMAWASGRLAAREAYDDSVQQREAREKLAYSIGRRAAGGLIPAIVATIAVAVLADGLGGEAFDWPVTRPDELGGASLHARKVWEAAAAGMQRPADPGKWLTDLRCAPLPMTDMGNAERFVARFGDDYRFTTAKGWMGWDGKRWHILDQENDVTPAVVMAAVFATVRAIQDEAAAVRTSGMMPRESMPSRIALQRTLDHARVDELLVRTVAGELMWISEELDDDGEARLVTRPADVLDAEARHDKVIQIKSSGEVVLLSDKLSQHGRASEGSSRLSCIANLAKRWLTVSIEDFDTDPFAINCANGTVRLTRERDAAGVMRAQAVLVPHNRADLISKLAPVDYDPDAPAVIYDAMMEWAQPDPAMRRYLHQWGGYSTSGHVGEQKLQFWYGRGANGKSTVIDAWAGTIGDYAGTIQIDTFLDQGLKKRGDAATPDLARLGGVRMLRASEPERGAKLNEALVKAATGGEPMAVRALHKGFFDLRPQFKLTIGGNYKPDVPGTDEGIWRRIKLVPWDSFLAEHERDEDMPTKLKAEYSGILTRLVAGLLDWMANGFIEPKAVTDATADYRDDSDPLARFLRMCVEVTGQEGDRVQSSVLHNVFCAWAKAAGEYDWKNKRFTLEMKAKGFKNKQSNGMQFLGLRLIKDVSDFIDADGRVIQLHDDVTGDGGGDFGSLDAAAAAHAARDRSDDDDYDDGFAARQPWQDRD